MSSAASKKNDPPPSRPVSFSRPLSFSFQQKPLFAQNLQSPSPSSYHAKPNITIRTNSMSLPGGFASQPRAQKPLARILYYGQQTLARLRRFQRIRSRRGGPERNWYQILTSLALLVLFLAFVRICSSGTASFRFSRSQALGPKMAETIHALESLQYTTSAGAVVYLDKEKLYSGVRRSRLYQGTRIRRQIMDAQKDPIIKVVNADTLDEALKLKRQGLKPIVLDMANREFPGGDYRADGTTQEAGLFRRTNLYQCLDTEPRRSEFYPLPSQGAVYCPNMVVLRKSSLEDDAFMDRPEWMSFLTMAPLRNPPLIPNEANELILGERAMIITKKKIQNMFRIALDNGHDAIVLSAFGCGRLHNPPESVARIFKEVIRSNYMGGIKTGRTFTQIVFAITDYKSRDADVEDSVNFDTFKRVMESPDEIVGEEESES
ncbi:hypothetical protein EMPS_03407 [Entomortierella parvispora]|uniref:Microbial-type PARG catalytic domain-containing protein n=1 Tax=Entomortierella parvispora TaxID=205924 RepID=A0A9P3H7B4_9FUNG|nr:hypothetical protein EMPS_03407 [Entomortierella parvispora]